MAPAAAVHANAADGAGVTRLDWVILRRIGSRIALAVLIIFGLIVLVESLDTWRFDKLMEEGGIGLALLAIIVSAARWTIKTLSVTVLIGATIGMLELQARQELTVIKSSGFSIWRLMRAPIIFTIVGALLIALVADGIATTINRSINYASPNYAAAMTPAGEVWFEQRGEGLHYVIMAEKVRPADFVLNKVTVFLFDDPEGVRIRADTAVLRDGAWQFETAFRFNADGPPQELDDYSLPTSSTLADLRLKLRSPEDMTLWELAGALATTVSDPGLRAAALTRLVKLLTLPVMLVGSLFIAFAFTAGYRRTSKYGTSVLYAIVLGFVVFVITEMADRAGSSGVLDPAFAAVGPACVAIVIGMTVLLHKEDGRA